jgi:ABC-2 type transport system ATP-binding protein
MKKPALKIHQLYKSYRKEVYALKGISLEVAQGDFFGLLGPNGAGKSTAIGIVSSLVNKSSGQVQIFGHDLDQELIQAKSQVGLVPQEFNFNVFEKVLDIVVNQAGYYGIPRREALGRAEYYLSKLGLWDKAHGPARQLSGGMKRRLMIARGLVHNPNLLILDEPTAGVDIELRRSMWDFLREINRAGTTIILTTHYLEEAEQLCRNIAIINQGQIVENTSVKSLLNKLSFETLILDVQQPIHMVPQIVDFDIVQIDETTLEVSYPRNISLNDLFDELSQRGYQVLSLRNKTNRLEELFVRLTQPKEANHS